MPHKAADRIRNVALIGHRGAARPRFTRPSCSRPGRPSGSAGSKTGHDLRLRGRRAGARDVDRSDRLVVRARRAEDQPDRHPGRSDFVADTVAALRVADAAVVVVNAVMGVEVHTDRLWERADKEGLARLVFVNMLDRERADFFRALESLQEGLREPRRRHRDPDRFRARGPRRHRPDRHEGVRRPGGGQGSPRAPGHPGGAPGAGAGVPGEADGRGRRELRRADGALSRRRGDRSRRDRHGAQARRHRGNIFPVTCGVATKNLGRRGCWTPSSRTCPRRRCAGRHGRRRQRRKDRNRARRGRGPIAYVFKTLADPYASA